VKQADRLDNVYRLMYNIRIDSESGLCYQGFYTLSLLNNKTIVSLTCICLNVTFQVLIFRVRNMLRMICLTVSDEYNTG